MQLRCHQQYIHWYATPPAHAAGRAVFAWVGHSTQRPSRDIGSLMWATFRTHLDVHYERLSASSQAGWPMDRENAAIACLAFFLSRCMAHPSIHNNKEGAAHLDSDRVAGRRRHTAQEALRGGLQQTIACRPSGLEQSSHASGVSLAQGGCAIETPMDCAVKPPLRVMIDNGTYTTRPTPTHYSARTHGFSAHKGLAHTLNFCHRQASCQPCMDVKWPYSIHLACRVTWHVASAFCGRSECAS